MPSVDRLFDDGILSGTQYILGNKRKKSNSNTSNKTITEMIFVPDNIKDGKYLLNLQFAPFVADAVRLIQFYKINEL